MAEDSLQLITSGSIVNLERYGEIGAFDEKLFIDQVDFDYSFRSRLEGFKTIRFNNVYLQHSLGKESEHISFKNFKKTKRSLHSPVRIYYMTRNFFYMRRKYSQHFPEEIAHMKKDLLYRLKNNFLYSPHRFALVKAFLSGYADYRKGKMGKRQKPF
jgi:rhamnosyltransferase